MATNVVEILSDAQFLNELSHANPNQLVVVDFFATWCGPCKHIAPILAGFSLKYVGVKFLKVDVDKCQATAVSNGIEAMPTFNFYRNKQKIDSLRGADHKKLEQMVLNLMGNHFEMKPDSQRVAVGKTLSGFFELQRNASDVFVVTGKLILRYANNILRDPDNLKYRQIRLGNAVFMEKLLPVDGAVNCFFSMGFEEMDDKLLMPPATSLYNLRALRDALTDAIESPPARAPPQQQTPTPLPSSVCQSTSSATDCIIGKRRLQYNAAQSGASNEAELKMGFTLSSNANQVLLYEEEDLQQLARTYIPMDVLQSKAEEAFEIQPDQNENSLKDCMLLQLLRWFKKEFFTWTDEPQCHRCNGKTKNVGHVEPSTDEKKWGAGRVEGYQCINCNEKVRFPRYNHPQKLLETRTGRCGEWANCFTLCCRAAGFEARYIWDSTDHVWTEVYSDSKQRWLHCDSCENTCDKPLTYETGWGKSLSYVIAFSKDEVIDVTWRYSSKHEEVLKRRNTISEGWLIRTCDSITKELQYGSSEAEKKVYSSRHIKELVEFVTPKNVATGEELKGRQSGSKWWREGRGEIGQISQRGHVFTLSEENKREKCFRLRYNPVKDCYYTHLPDDISAQPPSIKGYSKGVVDCENIIRKEESDWDMVYLARKEGTAEASLAWYLDLKNTGLCVEKVTVKAKSTCFEDGSILYSIGSASIYKTHKADNNEDFNFSTLDYDGEEDSLSFEANLKGGKGDVAWQHAQLFRTPTNDSNFIGLDITVTFRSK